MFSTASLLLTALFVQDPQEGVTLERLPSTVKLGRVVRANLKVETRQRPGDPEIPEIEGLHIEIGRPSTSRSMSFVNGRQSSSFSWNYPIAFRPQRVGKFTIGPIRVRVGDRSLVVPARELRVVKEITGRNFGKLAVSMSRKRVYVHEPVRFSVECAVDSQLELATGMAQNGARYYHVVLEAEWLAAMDGAELIDETDVETDQVANIVLNNSLLQPADVSIGRTQEGQSYHLFRFHKAILPTRAGTRKLVAPILKFTVLRGVRRDPFSMFPTRQQKEYFVYGKPLEVEVLPLPAEGRPEPYYGAVGRFSLAAELDKRAVKVGGSVKLVLTISGTGNLAHLQVPELGEIPGIHLLGRKENRDKDKVVVTYDLTPKTVTVAELPGVRWNYFDTTPGVEKYVEVVTDPLRIEVQALRGEEALAALPGEKPAAVELGVDDIFDIRPEDGTVVLAAPARPGRQVAWLGIALPWLLAVCGLFFLRARRRSRADVKGRRSRAAGRRFHKALHGPGKQPLDALVDYLADRLGCAAAAVIGPDLAGRLQAAGVEEASARQVQSLVDEGVAGRYGGSGGVSKDQAEAVVRALERTPLRVPVGMLLAGALLGLVACTGSPLRAQELSAAERAYRAGDYAAAAAGFSAEFARSGDRRAAYNLGNSLFRGGRYAAALAAYERARLAMPRDAELLANIRLAREHLDLGSAEGEEFLQTLSAVRDSATPGELFWICVFANGLAACLVCFGGRRLRVLGVLCLIPALLLALEVGFLGTRRPDKGIVTRPSVALRAEPSPDLEALMKIRAGVAVEVLGASDGWTVVRVRGRRGWVPSAALEVID